MPVQPLPAASAASSDHGLVRSLDEAGLSRRSLIYVTGPASLPALLWLCRQGYERAQHVHPQSPRCALEPADALLIPHLSQVGDLPALLPVAGLVREGGMLVVRAGLPAQAGETVAAFAAPFGYDLRPHFVDKGRVVFIASRVGLAAQRRAA
jgi:hypothetical protein